MIIDCRTENNPFINKQARTVTVSTGLEIADLLYKELDTTKTGIGLAANQIGIDAQVAVVKVRKPITIINPVIIKKWDHVLFNEGCLSYPGYNVNTTRFKNIIIHTEQEDSDWYFSGDVVPSDGKGSWEEENESKHDQEVRLLETIAVQHEIDHLIGKTILDHRRIPITINQSPGRNDPCFCGSEKKFKKCCMS